MPVVNPDHLLEQAEGLIALDGGAPRQVDLRRAVSNAYYALFHAILTDAADDFVGKTKRQHPRYTLVYRSISHRHLRNLCEDITKPTPPNKYAKFVPSGGFGSDLVALATAFSELQEKRHEADYDPQVRIRLSEAVLAVATSKLALVRLRQSNKNKRRAFLSLVVFSAA